MLLGLHDAPDDALTVDILVWALDTNQSQTRKKDKATADENSYKTPNTARNIETPSIGSKLARGPATGGDTPCSQEFMTSSSHRSNKAPPGQQREAGNARGLPKKNKASLGPLGQKRSGSLWF